MADVFQEVDEMMKQERVERFWKENGRWVIAFVVLSILGTAIMSGYKSWDKSVKEEQTSQLIAVLDAPDFPQGVTEKVSDLRPALRAVAILSAAQRFQSNDNNEQALSMYQNIAQDSKISSEFRHIAILMTTRLNADLDTEEKLQKLNEVYTYTDSPWRYHAYMEAALLKAHEREDFTAARQLLANISSADDVPASMKEKAQKLDHVYETKALVSEEAEGEGS